MTNVRVIKPALAALVAAAACAGGLAFSSAQPAQADTYSDLINAQNQHAASVQREAELKQQLAGASQDLANKVLELDDLTNNKIVAAQAKVTQANEDAATAQDEADAASGRFPPRRKTRRRLRSGSSRPARTTMTRTPPWPSWPVTRCTARMLPT